MSKIRKIKSINECPPDGRVILAYCERHGATVRNGHGDHGVASTDLGSCAVPMRPIGKGLFCKIIKTLAAIGISVLVIAIATGYITI